MQRFEHYRILTAAGLYLWKYSHPHEALIDHLPAQGQRTRENADACECFSRMQLHALTQNDASGACLYHCRCGDPWNMIMPVQLPRATMKNLCTSILRTGVVMNALGPGCLLHPTPFGRTTSECRGPNATTTPNKPSVNMFETRTT